MKKGKQNFKKILFLVSSLFILLCTVLSCNSWMEDDGFYEDIENEVKYANAPELQVFVRYAATKMGKTVPEGNTIFKKEIESTISATTETEYGFYRWAAFSTSFLEAGDKQHSDFVFDDAESYAEKYGVNELPDSVVHFEDRTNPTTKVTILEERNDVFLVPVVAKRPTVALTIPGNGSNGVVRNMTVRINFTKAMDVASFKNAEDVFDKITVNQGSQSITADGDIDVSSIDITDHFDTPTISTNGKMLTLKFTEDAIKEGFSAQSYVNVQISREVKDIYGYSMADDYTLSFQVGTGFDTLAPRISELSAGIKSDFVSFKALYKDAGTKDNLGSFTTFTSNQGAPTTLNSDLNNDYYSADLMAQRVTDKVNIRVLAEDISGSGTEQSQMGVESDVSQIMIRAIRVFNMDGNYVAQQDGNTKPFKSIPYVAQSNTSELEGGYADLITAANANLPESARLNKSKGFLFTYEDFNDFEDGLIRIDIGAVDAVGNTGFGDGGAYSSEYGNGYVTLFVVKDTTPPVLDTNRITSTSTASPYGYYNAQTFNTINVRDNGIYDAGAAKLRSPHDDIKWIIKAGADTSWVSTYLADDDSWKPITDDYPLGSVAQPSSDGPMAITYALMDDLGNISEGGQISSITYDNTAPVIDSLDWVDSSNNFVVNSTQETTTGDVYLKVPFTEPTSGVRRLIVSVSGIDNAFANSTYYSSLGDSPITVTNLDNTANPVKELSGPFTTGNFYIKNIKLGNTDGSYQINVAMVDQALNTSSTSSIRFSIDTTAPVVSDLMLEGAVTDSNSKNWVKGNTGHTVLFTVTEVGSGVNVITLSGADLVSPTLICNGTTISSSEYTVSGNTITLSDYRNPKICGENLTVQVTGVTLNANENALNTVSVNVKDFVEKTSTASSYSVYYDSTQTPITSGQVILPEYTNTRSVSLNVTVPSEGSGSGITKLILSGAKWESTNTDELILSSSVNTSSISITLDPTTDGRYTIGVKTVDLVGNISTETTSNQIVLDTTKPEVGNLNWNSSDPDDVPGAVNSNVISQTLIIPITETLSGIKKITIEPKKEGDSAYTAPFGDSSLTITDNSGTAIACTKSGNTITFTNPVLSTSTSLIKITNLKISSATAEGSYQVYVKLEDAAGNIDSNNGGKYINLANDSTAPVITKVSVAGLQKVVDVIDSTTTNYFISASEMKNTNATATTPYFETAVTLNVKEATSGVRKIELSGTSIQNNTSNIKLKCNGTEIDSSKYTVDASVENKLIISITNSNDSLKDSTGNEFAVEVSGIRFGGYEHEVSAKVYDVAKNDSNSQSNISSGLLTGITTFHSDYKSITVSKKGTNSKYLYDNNITPFKAEDGYTNDEKIELIATISLESINSSGINQIELSGEGGATFDSSVTVTYLENSATVSSPITNANFTISDDHKKLTFNNNKAITKDGALTINNIKLASGDGNKNVTVKFNHVTGIAPATITETIYLDKTAPVWDAESSEQNAPKGVFMVYDSSYSTSTYPRAPENGKVYGVKIAEPTSGENPELYFYTQSSNPKISGSATDAGGLASQYLYHTIEGGGIYYQMLDNIEAFTVAPHIMVAVDKAGNKSSEVKFNIVKDETAPATALIENLVTIECPENSKIHRGSGTYTVRPTSSGNEYKMIINLAGIAASSGKTLLEGSAASAKSGVPEINPTTTASPIYEYAVYSDTDSNCSTYHKYVKNSSTNEGNGFKSSVDAAGNIIIIVPNTSTAGIVKIALRDGCGNENKIRVSNNNTLGFSWVIDNKLGSVDVDENGKAVERSILMNPGVEYGTSSSEDFKEFGEVKFKWYSQSSPSSDKSPQGNGESRTGTLVKDTVKHITYYNDNAWFGGALGFKNASGVVDKESVNEGTAGKVTVSDPNNPGNTVYTMRIKLCCVPKNDPDPDQDYFTSHTANGQSTEWIYSNGGDDRPYFFLQYPHPDYDALGWGSTTEYKIYYLVEDYVGNYDIHTVVNSTDDTGPEAMVFWLYDNTPPVVTVGTTGKTPDDTSLSINELVPNNNGYQAYQYSTNGSTKNVAIAFEKTARPGATINETQREGTTRWVAGETSRYNCPFFDIKVTDNTGIRAFAYSKTETKPTAFGNAQQGEGKWFAGSSGSDSGFGEDTEIGATATDSNYVQFNKYNAGSDYAGKYSGTPVCSVFPNDYDNTPIYLHVMDWVGNVQTYRMGNNITWNKDEDAPKNNTTQFEEFAEQYYINSGVGILEFAGKKVNGQTTAKVYLPSGCYTDSGTAIFGWSLEKNNVATVDTDENGSYIQLDLSNYSETPSLEKVYIYDSVGNCLENSYNVKIDSTAPVYQLAVRSGDSDNSLYIKDQGYNVGNDPSFTSNYILGTSSGTTRLYEQLFTNETDIKSKSYYVYTRGSTITFLPYTKQSVPNDKFDASNSKQLKIEVSKWNGSAWNSIRHYNSSSDNTEGFFFESEWCTIPKITVNSTGSGYYCIALSDRAGNSNYAYVYAKQDNKAPTVEAICTNVNTINGINYYGPKGKVQYKITAEDSGIYEYGIATPYIQPTDTTTVTEDYMGSTSVEQTYTVHATSNTRVSANVNLSYGGYSKWTYIDTTPTCGNISQNQQYIYNPHYTSSNKIIQNVTVTRDPASGYSSLTISKTNTSGNLTLSTVTATGISSFSFKPNDFILNNLHPSAWKVYEGTLSSIPTKPDFVSWSDKTISDTDPYTFVSSNWTNKVYYFYPIDKAGNVGNPIAFSFETPVTPNVSAETHTGIYKNTSTNVTYFNKSSELKIKVTNPNSSKAIKITSYSISKKNTDNTFTTLKAEQFNEQNYINITPNSNEIITVLLDATDFELLNSENLYVQVQTEFTASDEKSFGKFCYDNTPPDITLSSVLCNSQAAGCGYKDGNSVIYGNNTSTVQLTLSATETGSGLKGYALSEDATTWSTDPITINRGATGFASSYTIYAKDNLGNVGSQAITFTLDDETPYSPNVSVKTQDDMQYVYYDLSADTLYVSKDSIVLKASTTATNVYTYKCNTTTSQTGEFTINATGSYSFCVINNVGNESNAFVLNIVKDKVAPATPTGTFTFYKDSTQAIEGFKVDTINNKVLFNPNLVNKAVFTPATQTDDAAASGDGAGSGIKGYSDSRTATTWGSTVTFDLSSSDSNTSKKVYVKDNVGNVCTSSLSYSFTADSTGPAPASGVTINENPDYSTFKAGDMSQTIKAINLPSNAFTVTTAQDDIVGGGYTTVMLNSGTKFTLALADSDCVGYGFTYGVNASALDAPPFTSVTPNDANKIEVTLPNNVVGPHYFIFLWLKDSLGNISTYNVMHDSHGWFLSKPTGSVSVTYSVVDENLIIEGLQQVPITSVQISGSNLNGCSDTINFDYNIETNYVDTKSYNKQYSKSGSDSSVTLSISNPCITGSGKITINVGNDATVSSIIINGDTTNISYSATTSSSPATKFIKAVSSSVRSVFTPKTKKIYLSSEVETKTIEKDTGVISQNNQPSLTKTASPKKNNKPKVRKANNSNKVLDSSVVKNTVIQKKNNVIPEDAKVLEVSSIEPSVSASVITSEVINNSGVETTVEKTDVSVSKHKQNSILVYSIIALVMCAVIAMVVIVNKIIIDKTK